jgi:uncharacterized protein (DUF2236 family)
MADRTAHSVALREQIPPGDGSEGSGAIGVAEVAGEWIQLAGGGCAILLQLAHPAVGRGVAEHSDFVTRPSDRLVETLIYVMAVACGDEADARAVRRSVGRAHAPVHGEADGETSAYTAFDPELQLWVAATLYWSAIRVRERVFGPLDVASAERVYREFAVVGTTLQMPAEAWPASRAAFDAYFADTLGTLRVLPGARQAAHDLLHARTAPWWMRAVMPWARLATVALLPEELHTPFGLRLTARNRRRYEHLMSVAAAVYPRLPAGLRFAVRDAMLRTLRARRS